MLQNIETLQHIRIHRDDVSSYDPNIWMNHVKVKILLKQI